MWTWKVAHVPGLQAIAKNFEAKTGIKVNVTAVNPDDAYRTKLTTSAQSGDLADIISYWTGGDDFWGLASSGTLIDITDKVDDAWKSQFLPGTIEKSSYFQQSRADACKKDSKCSFSNVPVGHLFSVPIMAGSAYFVYGNKALMKQAGLDPNTPPKTAEEWLDMMKAIKSKTGTAGIVTGVKNQDVSVRWLFNPLLMSSCGQEKYDAIWKGDGKFTDDCVLRVLNFMNQIARNDLWTADILQTDIDPADVAFSQGKAGFDIGGTYTLSFLLAQGLKSDDILAFPVPPLKGSTYDRLAVGVDALIEAGVTKDSQHKDQAIQFLKFLTSPEQEAVFAKLVGDLPAAKLPNDPNVIGAPMAGLLSGLDPANAPFSKSKAEPIDTGDAFKVLKVGLQQLITGETTPEKLAATVQTAHEADMNK